MQTQNKLIDDLARVATSALGVATGLRHEAEAQLRRQFERILADMDLVTREEYEVTRSIAETARAEQEALAERVAELERQLAARSKGATAAKSRTPKAAGGKTGTAKRTAPRKRTPAKAPAKGAAGEAAASARPAEAAKTRARDET